MCMKIPSDFKLTFTKLVRMPIIMNFKLTAGNLEHEYAQMLRNTRSGVRHLECFNEQVESYSGKSDLTAACIKYQY